MHWAEFGIVAPIGRQGVILYDVDSLVWSTQFCGQAVSIPKKKAPPLGEGGPLRRREFESDQSMPRSSFTASTTSSVIGLFAAAASASSRVVSAVAAAASASAKACVESAAA